MDNNCTMYTGSGSGDFGMECFRVSKWHAWETVACFGTEFSRSFVLFTFENTSTALTRGFVTSRLINTCPCCGIRYSHLRPSCLHLEHAGRERSHCLRSEKGPTVADSSLHCYLDLHALTYSAATCPVWKSNHFLKPFLFSSYAVAYCVTTARL